MVKPNIIVEDNKNIVLEGDKTKRIRIKVTLDNPSLTETVSFQFSTYELSEQEDPKGEYSASSGDDYFRVSSRKVVFLPGQTTKYITVRIVGDQEKEAGEIFGINIFNIKGADKLLNLKGDEIANSSIYVGIKDNDSQGDESPITPSPTPNNKIDLKGESYIKNNAMFVEVNSTIEKPLQATEVDLFFSTNSRLDKNDVLLKNIKVNLDNKSGFSINLESYILPQEDSYYLIGVVDPDNDISETNSRNNIFRQKVIPPSSVGGSNGNIFDNIYDPEFAAQVEKRRERIDKLLGPGNSSNSGNSENSFVYNPKTGGSYSNDPVTAEDYLSILKHNPQYAGRQIPRSSLVISPLDLIASSSMVDI